MTFLSLLDYNQKVIKKIIDHVDLTDVSQKFVSNMTQ